MILIINKAKLITTHNYIILHLNGEISELETVKTAEFLAALEMSWQISDIFHILKNSPEQQKKI